MPTTLALIAIPTPRTSTATTAGQSQKAGSASARPPDPAEPNYKSTTASSHSIGEVVVPVVFAQSVRDINGDGFSDISDVSLVNGAFGKQGGAPGVAAGYDGRYDLNYDSFVDIS